MLVETDEFDNRYSKYTFRGSEGCDANKDRRHKYDYKANGEVIKFAFKANPYSSMHSNQVSTITLDLDTMRAVMSRVEDSPELTCRIEQL